ncbi:hypothetical protein [Prochlorococcus sp. MIT 1341]|uniref:hypothetical protein n=1 Tax=Prochlorococcus sp. MIT 1341 TaxID=3096221 RepID=UPI002A750A51|nr:hypothetical protein [Prochlorococcus sp. MIT 1341]
MSLSADIKHKIYLAATLGYVLGSRDLKEISYYKQIKEEIKQDRRKREMGVSRAD